MSSQRPQEVLAQTTHGKVKGVNRVKEAWGAADNKTVETTRHTKKTTAVPKAAVAQYYGPRFKQKRETKFLFLSILFTFRLSMWHIIVMGTPPTVQSSMGMSRLLAQAMRAFIPFDVSAPLSISAAHDDQGEKAKKRSTTHT